MDLLLARGERLAIGSPNTSKRLGRGKANSGLRRGEAR